MQTGAYLSLSTEGISEPLPASPNIRVPEESTQIEEGRGSTVGADLRPTICLRDASLAVPGTTGRIGTAASGSRCDPVPLTNIAGARFEPTTLRMRERSVPINQWGTPWPGRSPWACLSDSPIRLEGRNGDFDRIGQISPAPQDFAPLSGIHRLRRARPTGFEPVTFGFVDCWSFDCHFGGVFPGFAGLSWPEPPAGEGLAVVPKDIAGARFVSQGDARILERLAA